MTVEPDVRVDRSETGSVPVLSEPAAERNAGDSETLASARRWIAPGAMAAGILLGALLAGSFGIGSDIHGGSGALFAQGNLAQRLASELSGNGTVGPSFWSKDGVFCRAFETRTRTASGLSGIACRETGGWRIRIVTETGGAPELPGSVKAVMANLIVGTALDPEAEQQARRQGWRSR